VEAAQSAQASARALDTFHDAAHDQDLNALNYTIGADEKIDVASATDREIVPNQGARIRLGSLFDEQDRANVDFSADGFSGVKNSVDNGKSGVKTADEITLRADEKLRAEVLEMRSRIQLLRAAAMDVRSAAARVAALAKQEVAEATQERIDWYREDAATAAETVSGVFDIIAGLVHTLDSPGDVIEKMGDVAAKMASHMNDEKIAAAKQKLSGLRTQVAELSKMAIVQTFAGTTFRLNAALANVEQQVGLVRSALGARKSAYGALGESMSKAVPSAPGKDKIAGSMAAIPLVEMVVMKAREIRIGANVPDYDAAAARGLSIARANHHPTATTFMSGCDQLRAAHVFGTKEERKWSTRRDELFKLKESMLGRRPGPEK
jgi:hypothetical protein